MSTNTAVAASPVKPPEKVSALVVMAARYDVDPAKLHATLRSTMMKDATDEQVMAFVIVANAYELNPFLKEIHAFPDKRGGIVPVVSVDGWCKLMNRQPNFDGIEFHSVDSENGKPYSVTARIYSKHRSHPVEVTEYFDECYRNTEPWNKCPKRMLRHKALIQSARIAFGFSGIMDEDEASMVNVTPVAPAPIFTKPVKTIKAAQPAPTTETAAVVTFIPAEAPDKSPQDELADAVIEAGFTFDQWAMWAVEAGFIAEGLAGFAEVPTEVAAKLIKSSNGMLAQLQAREGK